VAKIERFEDIEAWRVGRELAREVYLATLSRGFARDPALRDLMRRAAVSVVSNIAEGFGRRGDAEFRQFLSQAKGSANELRAQLYVATDAGYIDDGDRQRLLALAVRVDQLITGFMRYLSQSDRRGTRFRETPAPHVTGVGRRTLDVGQVSHGYN
jgi:four helix bundle protein